MLVTWIARVFPIGRTWHVEEAERHQYKQVFDWHYHRPAVVYLHVTSDSCLQSASERKVVAAVYSLTTCYHWLPCRYWPSSAFIHCVLLLLRQDAAARWRVTCTCADCWQIIHVETGLHSMKKNHHHRHHHYHRIRLSNSCQTATEHRQLELSLAYTKVTKGSLITLKIKKEEIEFCGRQLTAREMLYIRSCRCGSCNGIAGWQWIEIS